MKTKTSRKSLNQTEVGFKYGFRSGLEEKVAEQLKVSGVPFEYEEFHIKYEVPSREAKYTPDFAMSNGIIVETKGRFVTADRQKHILIKKQFPDLDIRFVFSNPASRISKTSKTTYAMWCRKHGFRFAKLLIPTSWIDEEPEPLRLKSLSLIQNRKKSYA